jgi:hypothetical protein
MALTSQQRSWCVLEFHKTVLWLCSVLSNSNLIWIRLLTSPFWSGTGISLNEVASVIMDVLQERITAAVKSVTPDMLQRVWSELDNRIDVSRVTRGGHIECVWYHMKLLNCMNLRNCSHQFCKNIPLSFDFITTWNQGVFLCSLSLSLSLSLSIYIYIYIYYHLYWCKFKLCI